MDNQPPDLGGGSVINCSPDTFSQTPQKDSAINVNSKKRNNIPEDHKISINGHKLNIIFDPPHLIKGIRNNFLNKDLSFSGKTAQWNDIIAVYNADCQLGDISMLHKITNDHIQPTTSQKMKDLTRAAAVYQNPMMTYTKSRFKATRRAHYMAVE